MSYWRFILLQPPEHTEFTAALLLKHIQIMPLVAQNMELNMECPGHPCFVVFLHAHVRNRYPFHNRIPPSSPYCPTSSSCPVDPDVRPATAVLPTWKERAKEPLQTPVSPPAQGTDTQHAEPAMSIPLGTPGCGVQDPAPAGRASLFARESSGDLYYVFGILRSKPNVFPQD